MGAVAKSIVGLPARGGGPSYLSQMQVIASGSIMPSGSAQYWTGPSINWQTPSKPFGQWRESGNRWYEAASVESPYWTDPPIDWAATFKQPKSRYRVFQAGRTILVFGSIAEANVQWLEPTLACVESLLALDASTTLGRDLPPSPESVVDTVTFLSRSLLPTAAAPSLAPLNNGGLQAEWHRGGLDIEIVFSADEDERGIYIRDKQTGQEQELPLDVAAFKAAVGDALNVPT
jgi:hypothetical protein